MKTLILSTAAALALATPALADIDTARDVHKQIAAEQTSNDGRLVFNGYGVAPGAAEVFAQLYAEDESNNRGVAPSASDIRVSTKGSVSADLQGVFARIAEEDESTNRGLLD